MRLTRRFRLAASLLLLTVLPLGLARGAEPPDFARLDAAIEEAMRVTATPGAAVVVVAGDRVVHRRGYGTTSLEAGRPVAPETLFRLGSTTKIFVALAAVRLAAAGRLDLDAPIGRYAPDLHPSLAGLTLHQLLSHTAGLADDAPMEGPHDESALGERGRAWDERAFFAAPGEVFSYANPGYVLAGYVLERVEGKPFADVVREQVLAPLGMARSTFRPLAALTWPLALGHEPAGLGARVLRPLAEHDWLAFAVGGSQLLAALLPAGALWRLGLVAVPAGFALVLYGGAIAARLQALVAPGAAPRAGFNRAR
jgi:CubicO group peptidase (beta-lactamase class C family)